MDKKKDYEQARKKFHLTYNFTHKDQLKKAAANPQKAHILKYLSTQQLNHELIDHNEEYGRGTKYDS